MSKSLPKKDTYKIGEVARILRISIGTLRNWERQGKISSLKSAGGHRLFDIAEIEKIIFQKASDKFYHPRVINIPTQIRTQVIVSEQKPSKFEEVPVLYSSLHFDQKKVLFLATYVFLLFCLVAGGIKGGQVLGYLPTKSEGKQTGIASRSSNGTVLQASTGTPTFGFNIEAVFRKNAFFEGDVDIAGDLTLSNALVVPSLTTTGTATIGTDLSVNGGDITSTATTFNLLNTTTTTLNIGGAATAVNIGATTGTTTIKNAFNVDGATTLDGSLTVSGSTTLGTTTTGTLTSGAITASGDLTLADTNTFNIGGSGSSVAYNIIGDSSSGASASMDSDDDLYIEGNLEVDGTIIGAISGGVNPGLTNGSVLFQGPTGIEEDNTNFFWDDTNNRIGIGTNAPSRTLEVTGSTLITNNTTTNTTIDLTSTGDFTVADSGAPFITFNSNGNVVLADGHLLDLSTVVHDDSSPQGVKLPQAGAFTNITGGGEGYLAWNSTSNTLMTYDGSSWTSLGGSTNYFTDSGATTYLTSTTDNFALGGTDSTASFYFTPATSSILLNPYGAAAGNTGSITFAELVANGSSYTGFKSPDNLTATTVYALPTADATVNNQVLASNTAGQLAWIDVSSGAGSQWTTTGSIVHLVNNTDDFALGGSTVDAALFFDTSQSGLHLNPFGGAAGNTAEIRLEELEANGDSYTGLKAPDSLAGNIVYTLPSADATAANQVLASSGTGTLSWIDITGGANSPFTKSATNVYLNTTTDELILGGTSPLSLAKFSIDGDADQIQMIVQGNATQTNDLVVFEDSAGTDVFNLSNAGNLTTAGNLDINGTGTHDIAGTLNLSGNALTSSGDLTITPAGGDVSVTGNIALTGTLAVNGDTITSDSNLTISATGYTKIGDTGTPATATADDDLYVQGNTEIDGDMYVDGGELFLAPLASSASTTEGTVYYDSDVDKMYVYANGAFARLATDMTKYSGVDTSFTDGETLTVTHNQATNDVITELWEYDASASAYIKQDIPQGRNHVVSASPDDQLRGWWKMNEASGNLTDSSRYGQTLTANGSPAGYSAAGFVERANAIDLDGTDDYFSCTDANCGGTGELDMPADSQFTYGAWFKWEQTANAVDIVLGKGGFGGANGYALGIGASGGPSFFAPYCVLDDGVTAVQTAAATNGDGIGGVSDDNWHFAACVISTLGTGLQDSINLYVDGRLVGTNVGTMGSFDTTTAFQIGAESTNYFTGPIQEAFVYARALSPQEIEGLYQYGAKRYKIVQPDTNTVTITNFSGKTQDVKADVIVFGADLAEWYGVNDSSIESGDVVSLTGGSDSSGVPVLKKGVESDGNSLAGVISTKPGKELGLSGEGRRLLALSGRVPVKIDPDSQPINVGDALTASGTKPGYAKKLIGAGYSIGKATEDWNKDSSKSLITVLVGNSFMMGSLTDSGLLNTGAVIQAKDFSITTDQSLIERILGIKKPTEEALVASDSAVATDSGTLTATESATPSSVPSALSITDALEKLVGRLESVEGDLTLLRGNSLILGTATESATLSTNSSSFNMITTSDLVATNGINVGGLSLTDGSIDTIGTLKIQPSALGRIELVGGSVVIDEKGNITAKEVTADKYNVTTKSSGSGTITSGQTSIFVDTPRVTKDSLIFITPTTLTGKVLTMTEKSEGIGFKVEITSPETKDIKFNWWLIN